jgi:hypothetical protein
MLKIVIQNGGVAQLARVLDWQSKGRGFEPHHLHITLPIGSVFL